MADPHPRAPAPLAVVGLGASAGGLEPLQEFLRRFPIGHGVCFVVVQHLAPAHSSALPALLQSGTPLRVREAVDGAALAADEVHVIAPATTLTVAHGRLKVAALMAGVPSPPHTIDMFLASLAAAFGPRAVGVVLSGMGSDGSEGLRALVEQGGLGLVQTPESAAFDSMPRQAIALCAGVRQAHPRAMPQLILEALGVNDLRDGLRDALPEGLPMPAPDARPAAPAPAAAQGDPLAGLLARLAEVTGHDFSQYKPSTIRRRVERRMAIHACRTPAEYLHLLQGSDQEAALLFKELLIGVTSFFRDPPLWQCLQDTVLPELLANKARRGQTQLRAWVVGCSTGEEAYTLGMLLIEALDALPAAQRPAVQIFASDLSDDAIRIARRGLYPAGIAAQVSTERLARHFVADDNGWRVGKVLRECVLFARHDVLGDAPFTRLDLVSCRNLLIYFRAPLQRQVLPLFHYALHPGGHLLLGNAETVGRLDKDFVALDATLRVYRRSEAPIDGARIVFPVKSSPMTPSSFEPADPAEPADTHPATPAGAAVGAAAGAPASLQAHADRLMLAEFGPAAVLVDIEGDIVYVSGRTGRFLEPAAGKANWNVHAMAREGLRIALVAALREARAGACAVERAGLVVDGDSGPLGVDLLVRPVDLPGHAGLALIVFRDTGPVGRARKTRRGKEEDLRLRALEEELQALREEMRSSQEELQSSNEELQSTNEELQSANEELTTSKEEMQAMNEELQTVNAELMSRLQELALAQSDLRNLLNSTQIATLFLDGALNVRRFTEEMRKVVNLRDSDIGRPLSDLSSPLDYPTLAEDIAQVLRTLEYSERAVPTHDGRWFSVRVMPYRTQDNVIDGSVLTFVDITRAKDLESRLRQAGGAPAA